MTDSNELNARNQALESENKSLKQVIEQLNANVTALDQTVMEVLRANISLKAGCALLEKKITSMTNDISNKDAEIELKDQQIKSLSPLITESEEVLEDII